MVSSQNPQIQAKYYKAYIGLTGPDGVQNFLTMRPRKGEYVVAHFKMPYSEETDSAIDESELEKIDYQQRQNRFRVRIRKSDLDSDRKLLLDLIRRAHEHYSRVG